MSVFPRKLKTGIISTMNVSEEMCEKIGYGALFDATVTSLSRAFGDAETFCCYDTYQFPDYSKVVMEYMDPIKKAARRAEVFPEDCRKAFELGCRLTARE